MAERSAVIGIGQTKHAARRGDLSMPGLLREAALRALADADLGFEDIDAVVFGKAPDMFEGSVMPELFLADALGASGKPMLRVHTAGSVGGSTGVVASHFVSSGLHGTVLAVAWEKQSESNAMWALSAQRPFQPPLMAGAGGYFAPLIRAYIRRSGAPDDVGIRVAVKDRKNALKNPYAHLHLPEISEQVVRDSPMLWDPIRHLETCPSSDGACAVVIGNERAAKRRKNPAWIRGTALRSEPTIFAARDQVNPQAGRDCAKALYAEAGIRDPMKDVDCAELYVPFSWFEPMWLENLGFAEQGTGHRLTMEGQTELGGSLPINMSGGVLSTNPIGASGLLRFAEAALQVRGLAGEHQVDGAKMAVGHAYGGGSQFFAMWAVSSEPG
jgi:acetyl-CoA C-acetyltransferase